MGHKGGVPLLGAGGAALAVRDLPVSGRRAEEGDDGRDGNRVRVQRAGEPGSTGADQTLALHVLVTFTRYLVRNMVSRDLLWLCLHWTQKDLGLSDEEMKKYREVIFMERELNSMWPKDF